jgi:hypothetical protein
LGQTVVAPPHLQLLAYGEFCTWNVETETLVFVAFDNDMRGCQVLIPEIYLTVCSGREISKGRSYNESCHIIFQMHLGCIYNLLLLKQ